MSKFFIETIATVKHVYVIEAESEDEAVDKYFDQQGNLEPFDLTFVGELLDNVNEICCEDHYQDLVNSKNDDQEVQHKPISNLN